MMPIEETTMIVLMVGLQNALPGMTIAWATASESMSGLRHQVTVVVSVGTQIGTLLKNVATPAAREVIAPHQKGHMLAQTVIAVPRGVILLRGASLLTGMVL